MTCGDSEEADRRVWLSQRHEFILAYYKMAVADLDRHLKAGWQTIVIIGAAVAVLSVDQDKFPAFLTASVALALAFWGLLNVVDSNYWASRAIAFLANVEAVYFTEKDREAFNPYVGYHPPYGLLDSLKYQFIAVALFIVLVVAYYAWQVFFHVSAGTTVSATLNRMHVIEAVFWAAPFCIFAAGIWYTAASWFKRAKDYKGFMTGSPGPGMIQTRDVYRGIDLVYEGAAEKFRSGRDMQKSKITNLEKLLGRWGKYRYAVAVGTAGVLIFIILYFVLRAAGVA